MHSNMNTRAMGVSVVEYIFAYIFRPLMNTELNLFNNDKGKGHVSIHGNFAFLKVCHETANTSIVSEKIVCDQPASGNISALKTGDGRECKDLTNETIFVAIHGANNVIFILACLHVFILTVRVRKKTHIDDMTLAQHAALSCFVFFGDFNVHLLHNVCNEGSPSCMFVRNRFYGVLQSHGRLYRVCL
ncbi:hypothetical protein DPMN_194837 [Dreissena polymorpha]|uniref:Uncharacterized protein n=1 Tax=Dreissena polymorpha TaxID=45954 RepID=A0A9D4BG54_DREPO|nr:hypothetical protein DPMN_194837 [Dreissena polymorpha]